MNKICKGCGETLQSNNPNMPGYFPNNKSGNLDNIICKRCFRLKHYGENLEKNEDNNLYKLEIEKAIKQADIILPIFDILDFESSFTEEIIDLLEDKIILAIINKIDLLPSYIHIAEISKWVSYYFEESNFFPEDIAYISAKKKYGINGILRKLQYISKNILNKKINNNIKIAIIGVSNVGKSNLINLLLQKNISTVSKFSGTTKKITKNIKKDREFTYTIIDTPGLIPNGRLSDLLNSDISYKLVPSGEIKRKTFRIKKHQIFMFSNLIYFEMIKIPDGKKSAIISTYASRDVKFHLTNINKVNELQRNDYFSLLDEENKEKYFSNKFINTEFEINENEDLVISGLGYLEVKRGPIKIRINHPEKVNICVRKSISKNSTFDDISEEYDDIDGDLCF